VFVVAVGLAALPSVSFGVQSQDFHAKANGYNEILQNVGGSPGAEAGAINTDGFASLRTHLDDATQTITFRFEFSGLTSNLVQAHYHFSQRHQSGGVMVFLCGGGGQAACPATTFGVVSGTITPGNVIGPTAQNISVGNMTAVFNAIRNDAAYLNLHTTQFPGGEIRGQLED